VSPLQVKLLAAINRQLTLNAWAQERLVAFGGQTAQFDVAPFAFSFSVAADGSLAAPGDTPDVTLTIPLAALPRLARGDETTMRDVRIAGNAGFAQELATLARQLKLDVDSEVAAALGRVLPGRAADIAATVLGRVGRGARHWAMDAAVRGAANVSEYFVHEQPQVAGKMHVDEFVTRVDALRERLDRLEKRVTRLA
jgi:ubiquinone biosynthesis accessory factor UbiJ